MSGSVRSHDFEERVVGVAVEDARSEILFAVCRSGSLHRRTLTVVWNASNPVGAIVFDSQVVLDYLINLRSLTHHNVSHVGRHSRGHVARYDWGK